MGDMHDDRREDVMQFNKNRRGKQGQRADSPMQYEDGDIVSEMPENTSQMGMTGGLMGRRNRKGKALSSLRSLSSKRSDGYDSRDDGFGGPGSASAMNDRMFRRNRSTKKKTA